MRKLLGAALALSLAAVAGPARGDDAADARAVLDQAIKAMGGEANLTKYKAATWKGKGTINLMGNEIEFTGSWQMQLPSQYRAEVQSDFNGIKFKQVRAIDGDKGWQQRNDKDAEDLDKDAVGEEKKQMAGQALTTLVPLKGKGFKLEKGGEAKVGDQPAVVVKMTAPDGHESRLFFDKKTHLLAKVQAKVKDRLADKDVDQEVLYTNYKEVKGIKRAMKVEIRREGKKFLEMELTDFQPQEKLDAKVFAKP